MSDRTTELAIRARVLISGRVQGVGFRFSTREEATRRGVAGWVKNRPDGRVEAVFEGTEAQVEGMIHWCHQGPRSAQPTGVEVHCETPEGLQGFEIHHH